MNTLSPRPSRSTPTLTHSWQLAPTSAFPASPRRSRLATAKHYCFSGELGEVTDECLMARIQAGDEAALATLQNRHHALLRTIIRRMISNDHDAEELVLECILEIWRHAANYCVEKGNALGWIVTLARRRTIDRIRRKMTYKRTRDRLRQEVATSSVSTHAGADEEAARSDIAEIVAELISHLPVAQQQVVQLAFFRGMSQREIAAHTGIPLGTIKTRLDLGLRKLRSAALAFGELHESRPACRCATSPQKVRF